MTDINEQEQAAPEPIIIQKKQSFLIPALAAALLLGGGFFVGNMFTGSSAAPEAPAETETETKTEEHTDAAYGEIIDLGSQYVNLSDGHFLKIAVSAMYDPTELSDEHASEKGGKEGHGGGGEAAAPFNLAPARDTVLDVFSSMTTADLSAPDGRTMAKDRLLEAFRQVYGEDIIVALYFSEFVWE